MIRTMFTAPMLAPMLALAACSQAPEAPAALTDSAWTLDPAASELSYVTVKAGEIAEANNFEALSGSVSADGAAEVSIDLASVKTGVDIRDERMRNVFFKVADNPAATIAAQIDPAAFAALGVGESAVQMLNATLSLGGVELPVDAAVTVTRVGADRVLVVSDKPVIVDAASLNLSEGLAELQHLASLPSITPAVPVSFSLSFTR